MMWLASLLILTFLGGSFGEDFERPCFPTEMDKCDTSHFGESLPENAEELMEACQALQELGSCVVAARETCGHDEERISDDRNKISYLRSTCQEDNPIFKVISTNLHCINPYVKYLGHNCLNTLSDQGLETLMTHTEPLYDNYRSDLMRCLNDILDITCKAEKFGHYCGEDVKDAAETFLVDITIKPTVCTREIMEEVGPIYEIFKEILIKEWELPEALEEKRK